MTVEVLVEKKKLAKPPLEIYHLGDRVLRQPAKRVAKVDAEIKQLIREMLQTMYSADGIGLAAPQVAVHKQLIVVDVKPDEAATPPLILINPTITKTSADIVVTQEGCLSIPNIYLDVKRPQAIEVSYKDENGRPQKLAATGLLACCIQHEIDHLNGVLFVDRVENTLLLNQELAKHGFSTRAVQPVA
ncbi:peptide deformylase [Leptothermofonsia sichuanensis E412]|jgi:peptide deformylase|uniref:peptide deformylase n=1 Tax=Leptothermofonsia sichuanensis TaxID=2917832 RepID=UPI001CA7186E|nr:peptide deformylase [Leptothermofonsia sichuanensis]QZZ18845.1 peptide deformylase [Leptothermofonsia sichuanensis E412]